MFKALLVLLMLFSTCAVSAEEAKDIDPYPVLGSTFQVTPPDSSSDDCNYKITADFAAYTDKLSIFRDAFLNRDYSLDFYNQRRKQVFSFVILKRIAEIVTVGLYNGPLPLKHRCSFAITVNYRDKFGQDRNFEALTWRFDSETASKVDWKHFDPRDFNQIAPDYRLSQRISEWISDEPGMEEGQNPPAQSTCDMFLLNANAIFIRATSFCKKDYLDTQEGLAALAGARRCASMPEAEMRQKVTAAMQTLDRIAREHGRAAVCPFVEGIAQQVRSRTQ